MIAWAAADKELPQIEPVFPLPSDVADVYLHSIQQILQCVLPLEASKEEWIVCLNKSLPLVYYNPDQLIYGQAVPITTICPAEYTSGVGRYITDTLATWLVPGKQLPITGMLSLSFRFADAPTTSFYLIQQTILLSSPQELQIATRNMAQVLQEIRVNIMAVYYARYITSLKKNPYQHKNLLIQVNLTSLFNPVREWDQSLFNQFQGVLTKAHAEETIDQVKKNISQLSLVHPRIFDPETFREIAQYSHFFQAHSTFECDPRYISRVIACHYLLSKVLQEKIQARPKERHYSFKILRSAAATSKHSIGILFGFNHLTETEQFDLYHISEALRSCLPTLEMIPHSLVIDRRHDKMRFFYWEISQKSAFTLAEIKHIKEKLPQELIQHIETPVHPVFMPRNEEEILRTLILLSKQIKYVSDLPQVSIHYERQSESHLIFTVILVRLLSPSSSPLTQIIQKVAHAKVEIDDVRTAGLLRKRYSKEAATLRVFLDKTSFFRADRSVDLLSARQKIVAELTQALGEFRDFNGGMILKQKEAFSRLCAVCAPSTPEAELLLETYFYALRPVIMQTVHETALLQAHFALFQSILTIPMVHAYELRSTVAKNYLLLFIKGAAPSFKEAVVHPPSRNLAIASLEVEQHTFLGMIVKIETRRQALQFEQTIQSALQDWQKRFLCPVS